MFCRQHTSLLTRGFASVRPRFETCQAYRSHIPASAALLPKLAFLRPQPASGAGSGCRPPTRHNCSVRQQLPLSTMTPTEPQTVPDLDRGQFSSTLHLKALRLEAAKCQSFVKALSGCVLPLAVDPGLLICVEGWSCLFFSRLTVAMPLQTHAQPCTAQSSHEGRGRPEITTAAAERQRQGSRCSA